jgi:predicted Na+-dependent transporter
MHDSKWIFLGIVVWLVFTFLGFVLPTFLGLIFFLFVAPSACGYFAGRSKKAISIVAVSIVACILAAVVGLTTIGSVSPEQRRNVTGLDWNLGTLILVWVCLNALLILTVGYVRFRLDKHNQF